jgi:phospholipid N-methyltransferase/DNA-binding transcriptional MerR regulator
MADTSQATAQRLRALAATMTTQIEGKLYTQHDAQRLTRRRLEMIERAERQGLHLHTIQAALTVLADGHEQGTLPSCLAHITTRTAIERLLSDAADSAAHTALLALLPATAGQPTLAQRIARLERELMWVRLPGFFPTPPSVAERLLDLAAMTSGMTVLEPSAGAGDLADAIRRRCPSAVVSVIEWQHALVEVLQLKGYTVLARDFLTFPDGGQTPVSFDRIVMNPPFEHEQDIAHVRHATTLLAPGGRVVAIVSEGAFFRRTRTAEAFRQWLAQQPHVTEALPPNAFAGTRRPTAVHGRIVVIDIPPLPCSPLGIHDASLSISVDTRTGSDAPHDCPARSP